MPNQPVVGVGVCTVFICNGDGHCRDQDRQQGHTLAFLCFSPQRHKSRVLTAYAHMENCLETGRVRGIVRGRWSMVRDSLSLPYPLRPFHVCRKHIQHKGGLVSSTMYIRSDGSEAGDVAQLVKCLPMWACKHPPPWFLPFFLGCDVFLGWR